MDSSNNTSVDFNLTKTNNMSSVDKDASNKQYSSFRELNERDENFDTSLNSAFLNQVNLNSTDDSKEK